MFDRVLKEIDKGRFWQHPAIEEDHLLKLHEDYKSYGKRRAPPKFDVHKTDEVDFGEMRAISECFLNK